MTDLMPWTAKGRRRAFQNRWLSVELEKVALPDGREYEYTLLIPGGTGVGVAGFNSAGELLLEREYRHGVGEVVWQIPGGLTNGGENLQQAGLRELLEETGHYPRYVSDETVRYLGSVWDNPALGPGHSHLFAAWGLEKKADPKTDSQEYVTLHWRTVDWVMDAIRTGEIRDRVVIAAMLYLTLANLI